MARTAAKSAKKPAARTMKPAASAKPIKDVLSKSGLVAHLSAQSGVEPKGVKAVVAALEGAITSSLSKKGARVFVLPGLLKATAVAVAAKPKRKGRDPFTGEERMFAAKPASVKVKIRALKKLKDAAT